MAMTLEQAEAVAEKLYEMDVVESTEGVVREGYSGRGMYGSEVVALVVPSFAVQAVGYAFGALDFEFEDVPGRTDSMGRDDVVLY